MWTRAPTTGLSRPVIARMIARKTVCMNFTDPKFLSDCPGSILIVTGEKNRLNAQGMDILDQFEFACFDDLSLHNGSDAFAGNH